MIDRKVTDEMVERAGRAVFPQNWDELDHVLGEGRRPRIRAALEAVYGDVGVVTVTEYVVTVAEYQTQIAELKRQIAVLEAEEHNAN